MSEESACAEAEPASRETLGEMVRRRGKPFLELSAFYLVLLLIYFGVNALVPNAERWLPIGGLETVSASMRGDALDPVDINFELGFNSTETVKLVFGLLASLVLMLPVVWVYMGARRRREIAQSFVYTTLVLPMIITGIVFVVHHSLALAFSLAGIVAGVRFRHTLNDSADATFLFVGIAVGVACGINSVEIAAIVSLFFNYTVLSLWAFRFGERETNRLVFGRKWMTKRQLKPPKFKPETPPGDARPAPTPANPPEP